MQSEIEELLEGINTNNATQKSQEAITLIEKWITKVETFETKINMLFEALKTSEKMQELLEQELNEIKNDTYHYELIRLRKQLDSMQKLINKVPPEIIEQIEAKKKRRKERER